MILIFYQLYHNQLQVSFKTLSNIFRYEVSLYLSFFETDSVTLVFVFDTMNERKRDKEREKKRERERKRELRERGYRVSHCFLQKVFLITWKNDPFSKNIFWDTLLSM